MNLKTSNRYSTLFALLVFLMTLVSFIRTLMPGTVGGDAGELQYAAPLLALVHPTGQPLYVLLGKLWTEIIPIGSIAYRMNLLAAVSTASGCAALAWLVGRIYGLPIIGAAASLTLGFGATVWSQAVLADKYGFNVLLASVIIGLALWWGHAARRTFTGHDGTIDNHFAVSRQDRLLYALSAAFGIGLLHHRSLALFGVGIAIMVVVHLGADLWRRWRRTLICAGLVFVPALMVYPTVLPWLQSRELSPLLWQPQTAQEWVDFLLERHVLSTEALVFDDTSSISRQIEIYVETLFNDFTPAVLLVGLLGMVMMLRRYPTGAMFLLISFGLQAFLSANFRGNERQFTYYLPSFVTLLYGYAYGLVWLWNLAVQATHASRVPDNVPVGTRHAVSSIHSRGVLPGRPYIVTLVGITVILTLPAYQFLTTYPERRLDAIYGEPLGLWRETLKSGDMGERLSRGIADLPPGAVLAADWEQVTILWYKQQVEGVRPDLTILYPIERYNEYMESSRPICLARHMPVDTTVWHPTNIGALVCLGQVPRFEIAPDFTEIGTHLYTPDDNAILELAAYQSDNLVYQAGTHAPLVIAWRTLVDIPHDYSVSLQVLDENWQHIGSRDIQSPVMGIYPTSNWVEGEVVQDYHEIDIPRTMSPGRYLWTVVVYRVLDDGSFEQLRDENGGINILGGTFEVVP